MVVVIAQAQVNPSTLPALAATPCLTPQEYRVQARVTAPALVNLSTLPVLAATLSHPPAAVPTHLGLEPQVVVSTRPAPLQEA